MRKEYVGKKGKKIVIEDGTVIMDGEIVHPGVYSYEITEIKKSPLVLQNMIKDQKIDTTDMVYVSGSEKWLLLTREQAEEAARQFEEIQKANDPENLIEGLRELNAAYADVARYYYESDKMMNDEYNDGVHPPKPIKIDPEELAEKYPRAAAYVKADGWADADNYAKSGAGEKARKRILAGEDYEKVIEEMEAEWHAAATEAVWNS